MSGLLPKTPCPCCVPALPGRRRVLALGAAFAVASWAAPGWGAAAGGSYDAMLLSCIDPRLVEPVHDWMAGRGLRGKYSQFVFAGAAVGVTAPAFADWHRTFWENLGTSVDLHHIGRVIAVDHRDCGAARIAFGADRLRTPDSETSVHREVFDVFRAQVAQRFPSLGVETGLMALDGSMQMFG